jgi:hypothetical protein
MNIVENRERAANFESEIGLTFIASIKLLSDKMESIEVFYDFNKTIANHNEIVIGLGRRDTDHQGIILNNKVEGYVSVSEFISKSSDEIINQWKHKIDDPVRASFYMEDLSPDTCLSFLLFFARMNGVEMDSTIKEWVGYVNRWESGDVKTTGAPFESWGCLLNALGHECISFNNEKVKPEEFKAGFLSCLRFTIHMIVNGMQPHSVKSLNEVEDYHRAIAILKNDQQEYFRLLASTEKVQLNLPLKGSQRKVLVDAFLAVEDTHIGGVLKSFIRNDCDQPFFKSGFGLMAIHSPGARGTGNDMVISVDPSLGVHLKDLWISLEHLEDEKWNGKRPCDQPRYQDLRSKANQPWYDEMEKCTIIAAPKQFEEGPLKGQPGSKCTWDDVLDLLWQEYHPLKSLKVFPLNEASSLGESCLIEESSPLITGGGKQFLALKWHSFGNRQSFLITPTIKRYFAAIADYETTGPIGILDLPPETSFDFLELPGGFTMIHRNGVLFFDDWSKDDSAFQKYKIEYESILERYLSFTSLHNEIKGFFKSVKDKLEHSSIRQKELVSLNKQIANFKMRLRETILNTMVTSQEFNILKFREKVEKRWGLNTQLDELYQTVAEIENIVKGYVETRTGSLVNKITVYGFPIAVGLSAFQTAPEDLFKNGTIHSTAFFATLAIIIGVIFWLRHRWDQ